MTSKKEFIESMGVFLAGMIGFLSSKIYQTWAMSYRNDSYHRETFMGGQEIIIWRFSLENPTIFLLLVVTIFSVLGYLIAKRIIRLWNIE